LRNKQYEGRWLGEVCEMSEIEKETTAVKSAVFGSQAYLMILLAETGNHRDFYQVDAC
jgi:hypothetical protein